MVDVRFLNGDNVEVVWAGGVEEVELGDVGLVDVLLEDPERTPDNPSKGLIFWRPWGAVLVRNFWRVRGPYWSEFPSGIK